MMAAVYVPSARFMRANAVSGSKMSLIAVIGHGQARTVACLASDRALCVAQVTFGR